MHYIKPAVDLDLALTSTTPSIFSGRGNKNKYLIFSCDHISLHIYGILGSRVIVVLSIHYFMFDFDMYGRDFVSSIIFRNLYFYYFHIRNRSDISG